MNSHFFSRQISASQNFSEEISKHFGINKILSDMLVLRGIDTVTKADKYINCGIKNLNDPFLLGDMRQAADKINKYIDEKKSIVIYGDYDADGICSVAILYLYFLSKNTLVNWYIPEREEGYGINIEAVDYIAATYKPDLIISVDCGITAAEEVKYIKSKGIDIIISDHHNSFNILPDCLVINPKISDGYPFKDLCGAGVALKLVQALGGFSEAEKYIDIAAIATIADSVELSGENRDIVSEGLKKLNTCCRKGIKFLYDAAGLKDSFNTYTIAFGIVPRINAAGRIGQAKRALTLFYEEDENILKQLAGELSGANTERQLICEEIIKSVRLQAKETGIIYSHCIIVIDESCHTGVSGIVASKLCDEFYRPSFVFCETDGVLKGSGRSVEGINIFEMLSSMSGLFIRFGGHAYAVGITLKKENYEEFKKQADGYFAGLALSSFFIKKQYYDFDLTGGSIDSSFIKQLKIFEPCGVGNSRPKFLCRVNNINAETLPNYPKHISFKLFNTDFIAFNFGSYIDILNSETENNLLFEFQQNIYNGREYGKGYLKDFNYNTDSMALENKIISNYIMQLGCKTDSIPDIELYDYENIYGLIKQKLRTFGTLIVVFCKKTLDNLYNLYPDLKEIKLSVFSSGDGNNISKILLAPDTEITADGYENIIFADTPFSSGYISRFKNEKNTVYVPRNQVNNILQNIKYDLDRETFKIYFKQITDKNILSKPFVNIGNLYYNISRKNSGMEVLQFTVCYIIFTELEILYINKETDRLCVNEGIKKELESSEIYQKLKFLAKLS